VTSEYISSAVNVANAAYPASLHPPIDCTSRSACNGTGLNIADRLSPYRCEIVKLKNAVNTELLTLAVIPIGNGGGAAAIVPRNPGIGSIA